LVVLPADRAQKAEQAPHPCGKGGRLLLQGPGSNETKQQHALLLKFKGIRCVLFTDIIGWLHGG
jgi:hypothetical protein